MLKMKGQPQKQIVKTRTGERSVYVMADVAQCGEVLLTADAGRQLWWAFWKPNAIQCKNLTLSDHQTPKYIRDAFDAYCREMVG